MGTATAGVPLAQSGFVKGVLSCVHSEGAMAAVDSPDYMVQIANSGSNPAYEIKCTASAGFWNKYGHSETAGKYRGVRQDYSLRARMDGEVDCSAKRFYKKIQKKYPRTDFYYLLRQ